MACDPPAFPHAPHPDLFLLAQPGRAVVRAADRQETAPRHLPLNPGPGERHSRLDRSLERTPPTLHLDQDRRRNPRTPQLISSTNSWRRTLDPWGIVATHGGRPQTAESFQASSSVLATTEPSLPSVAANSNDSISFEVNHSCRCSAAL